MKFDFSKFKHVTIEEDSHSEIPFSESNKLVQLMSDTNVEDIFANETLKPPPKIQ